MGKKILIIGAHPDDETLGMGGTIAKMSSLGHSVQVLIITDGSSAQYDNFKEMIEIKKAEAKKSMNILGAESIDFRTLPDMRLDTVAHVDINKVIEDKIMNYEPDTVYTHHWGDINLDHRLIFQSTIVASRNTSACSVKEVYTYETPSSTEWMTPESNNYFRPNVYVDITNFIDTKTNALKCYKTEMREYPHPRSPRAIRTYAQRNGIVVGREFAERFFLVRTII